MKKTIYSSKINIKIFRMKEISNKEDFSDSSDSDTSQRESEDEGT